MAVFDNRVLEALRRSQYITEYTIYPRHNTDINRPYAVQLLNVPSFSAEDVEVVYNGQLLSHWVETKGTVWIKLPYLPATAPLKVYTLTGNTSPIPTSSGKNTFIFFDDFNRADGVPGNGWVVDNGTGTISINRLLIGDSSTDGRTSNQATGEQQDLIVNADVNLITQTEKYFGVFLRAPSGGTFASGTGMLLINNLNLWIYDNGANLVSIPMVLTLDTWYHTEIRFSSTNYIECRVWLRTQSRPTVAQLTKSAFSPAATGTRLGLSGAGNINVTHAYFDNVFIRRYSSIEPTIILNTTLSKSLLIHKLTLRR